MHKVTLKKKLLESNVEVQIQEDTCTQILLGQWCTVQDRNLFLFVRIRFKSEKSFQGVIILNFRYIGSYSQLMVKIKVQGKSQTYAQGS